MLTETNFQRNRATLAANLRAQFGLSASPLSWTYDERNTYLKSFAAFVLSKPSSFSAQDLANARDVAASTFPALENGNALGAVTAFLSEAAAEGAAINADLNPFSEKNRTTTFVVLGVGVFLYFVGPPLIRAYFQSKGKASA